MERFINLFRLYSNIDSGSGCGSVGRAVASKTRGPRFESSHWQKFIYIEHLFTANCVLKRQKKEKEAGNGPFKKNINIFNCVFVIRSIQLGITQKSF